MSTLARAPPVLRPHEAETRPPLVSAHRAAGGQRTCGTRTTLPVPPAGRRGGRVGGEKKRDGHREAGDHLVPDSGMNPDPRTSGAPAPRRGENRHSERGTSDPVPRFPVQACERTRIGMTVVRSDQPLIRSSETRRARMPASQPPNPNPGPPDRVCCGLRPCPRPNPERRARAREAGCHRAPGAKRTRSGDPSPAGSVPLLEVCGTGGARACVHPRRHPRAARTQSGRDRLRKPLPSPWIRDAPRLGSA
jgi:hypothetical protein